MNSAGPDAAGYDTAAGDPVVLWSVAVHPRWKPVLSFGITRVLSFGLVLGRRLIGPRHQLDPGPLVVVGASAVLGLIRELRARVVLRNGGMEVRGPRTRVYRWENILSVSLDDLGRVEITPDGWYADCRCPATARPQRST